MKKLLLSLLCLMTLFIANAQYSWVTSNGTALFKMGIATDLNGVQWTPTTETSNDFCSVVWNGKDDTWRGQQFGKNKASVVPLKITAYAASNTIFANKQVTKIIVNASAGDANRVNLSVKVDGETYLIDGKDAVALTSSQKNYTFEGSKIAGDVEILYTLIDGKTTTKAVYLRSIDITYEESGSTPDPLAPAGLSFSAAEHTVNVGETVDGLALTKPEGNTGVVTYTSSNDAIATVNAETGAVTGVAAGTVTITATSTETDTYKAGKASYTLTVVDPNAPVATGAMFDFTTADLAKLTTSSIEASKATTANATNDLTGVTLTKDGVTISFADGGQSNKPRWWDASSSTELRIYKDNTMTVTAPANMKLTSIEFTKGSKKFALVNCSVGSIDDNNNNKVWTPATQERAIKDVTFTPTDRTDIGKITVNYESINTGVDDILSDDANAPVEYYNLQGVRVANPESGLYIRVQGKKATKVLVK